MQCPKCSKTNIVCLQQGRNELGVARCIDCGHVFKYDIEPDEDE